MNRLHSRFLFSYILIIVVTLTVISFMLLIFFHNRPLPHSTVYRRLGDVARGAITQLEPGTQDRSPEQIKQVLQNLANATELRILLITRSEAVVLFDSLGKLPLGNPLPRYRIDPPQGLRPNVASGAFVEDDGEWLFVSRTLPTFGRPAGQGHGREHEHGDNTARLMFLFASPAPKPSLQETFALFSESFLRPLLQAGIVGLGVAVILALLLARSIAQPLQQTARAAEAVASGDLDQQVPETGPTEIKTLAHTFNHMTRAVRASRQTLRDFVANVSHDLRTPLTSIQGFSQAILDGTAAPPDGTRRAAVIIHDEAARMSRMVDALLELARLESGQLRMRRDIVNPAAILAAVGEQLALRADAAQITLHYNLSTLPDVIGDGDRLAQVFTNLVDNALKHTPEGGTITLEGARAANAEGMDGLRFSVTDTGAGIAPAELARVFERFYQLDKARIRDVDHAGVGLGLAISREIVEAHGGHIHAESAPGQGAKFVVWLPLTLP